MAFRPTTTCDIWLSPTGTFDPSTDAPDLSGVSLQTQKSLAAIGTDQADVWETIAYLIFRFVIATATLIPRVARAVEGTARPILGIPDKDGELYEVRDVNRVWETDTISLQYLYCVPWPPLNPSPTPAPTVIDRENSPNIEVGDPVGPVIPCVTGDATLSIFFSPDHVNTVPTTLYSNLGNYPSTTGADRNACVWWALGPVMLGDAVVNIGGPTVLTEMLVNITGQDNAGPTFHNTADQFGTDVVISDTFTPTDDYLVIVFLMSDSAGTITTPTGWVEVSQQMDTSNNRTYGMYYKNFSAGVPFPGETFVTDVNANWTYGILYWTTP